MTASPEDQAYVKALGVFEKQVGEATHIWFAASAINQVAVRNKDTENAINLTPSFWRTVHGALQQHTLVAIGRIFDQSRKTPKNIDTILRLTFDGRETVFAKKSIEARKRRTSGNADEWIGTYLKSVYIPTQADFKRFSRLVKKYRKIYQAQYEPIRHKHIAHTEVVDDAELAAMYANTNIRDLERLIVFLNKFHGALWQLYYNGNRPALRPMRWSVRSLVKKKLADLSQNVIQEDIVAETRICLALLTQAANTLPRASQRSLRWE